MRASTPALSSRAWIFVLRWSAIVAVSPPQRQLMVLVSVIGIGWQGLDRRFVPSVEPDDIRLGGTGFQAALSRPDEPVADFMIRPDHRNPRLIQAAGIDSLGLTSCLEIGAAVRELVENALAARGESPG